MKTSWITVAVACTFANISVAQSLSLTPAAMPAVSTVDARYQSFNVEMVRVVGDSGKSYDEKSPTNPGSGSAGAAPDSHGAAPQALRGKMPESWRPINLADPRLRKLAAALGPTYIRVSGTSANSVYFHDSDTPAPTAPPKGFTSVLTRGEWQDVVDFVGKVDGKLVTSFAFSPGVRNDAGVWTTDQAQNLIDYTKSIGGEIVAVEFVNEPNLPSEEGAPFGYSVSNYARDFAIFRRFIKAEVPGMRIAGPGTVGEGDALPITVTSRPSITTIDIFAALAPPRFDIFSYHSYPAASLRCELFSQSTETAEKDALTDEWLTRPDQIHAFYLRLRDRYEPRKPVWITQTANAACDGRPWASTFLDSFRYLDQLGRLARSDVKVIFHNALAASDYGLLDQDTFSPRPNYWAALLWRTLMGAQVLDAGRSSPDLKLYAHCLPGHPGGVTILAINNSRIRPASIELPLASQRYTLTSRKLDSTSVELNGNELKLDADDELPSFRGDEVKKGNVDLPPASITFLAVPEAENGDCK